MLRRLAWIRMLATFSETRLNSPTQASVHRFAKLNEYVLVASTAIE